MTAAAPPIVTSSCFAFEGGSFLLHCRWQDADPPHIAGLAFVPPAVMLGLGEDEDPRQATVATAVRELDRLLGEGKRPACLATMVEGDDCCFAQLARTIAAAEDSGRDSVGYGYACWKQAHAAPSAAPQDAADPSAAPRGVE